MGADQQSSTNGASYVGVTPQELHKERNPSRNPLKWFRNSSSSSSDVDSASGSSGNMNSRAKQAPLVVNHFPTANRPSFR